MLLQPQRSTVRSSAACIPAPGLFADVASTGTLAMAMLADGPVSREGADAGDGTGSPVLNGGDPALVAGSIVVPEFGQHRDARLRGMGARADVGAAESAEKHGNVADRAVPFGRSALSDINAFVKALTKRIVSGDVDGDGDRNLTDVSVFIPAFPRGCE